MEKRFILLNFGSSNKKIIISQDVTYEYIKDLVTTKSGISNPKILYYDNDVEEYVDFEPDSIDDVNQYKLIKIKALKQQEEKLVDRSELQLINMVHTGEAQLEPCVSESVSESVSRSPETVQTSLNQTPSRKESPVCRTVSPACTATSGEGRGPRTPSTEPVKKSGTPWPRIYRLPKENIPRSVREKLDCGQEIGSRDRSLLLDAIYNEATQYNGGLYPTSEMYDNMVDGIFRDYAYLLAMGGLPSKSAREFWKDKLVFKFGNARKRIDKNHPEVISRSKKRPIKIHNHKLRIQVCLFGG